MKLLLDTHVWLWMLLDPASLGKKAASRLEDPANELWLSSISVWEALLLGEKKKLKLPAEPHRWIEQAIKDPAAQELPLSHAIALESRRIHLDHGDPADRFISATARVHGLILVTADDKLLDAKLCELLSAQ